MAALSEASALESLPRCRQGLKPKSIPNDLRGAEAPLFHENLGFRKPVVPKTCSENLGSGNPWLGPFFAACEVGPFPKTCTKWSFSAVPLRQRTTEGLDSTAQL